MNRRYQILPMLLLATIACDRKGARTNDFDSAAAAALAPPPGTPSDATGSQASRVNDFEIGHSLDQTNELIGGAGGQFGVHDTLVVSVHAEYANRGDMISARIRTGNQTVDSAAVAVPAPDSSHNVAVGLRFGRPTPWPRGKYQLEVFLGANSQGIKDFTISQP